jgi:Do/DeqQ family serine protease
MTSGFLKAGVLTVVVSAAAYGAWSGASHSSTAVEASPLVGAAHAAAAAPNPEGFADVVAKVTPGVVTIRTERRATSQLTQFPDGFPFEEFFGQRAPRGRMPRSAPMQRGLGSGVIVSHDGYILTNHHVIDEASRIQVELSDNRVVDGTLVGADPPSDLAVVKIEPKNLPVVAFGDSNVMRVGDIVLAIGNPLGIGQTVTMGIVSAKGRATGVGDGSFEDFLQTDAPINHGNSGGALVNTRGELVGINSQIMSPSGGNIGIGFAVPSNMAKHVMDQLVSGGRVQRGRLGVTIQGVTGDLAAGLGLDGARGALVSDVTPGSAAAKAGLRRGDVIVGYQGRAVTDTNALRNEIAGTRPGTTVKLEVLRDGRTLPMTASLDELAAAADDREDTEPAARGTFGMTVQPVTPELARQLELPRTARGLVITDVDPSGAAAAAGLREGDLIEQINGREVATTSELRAALDAAGSKPAVLLVSRQGTTVFVPLRRQ